MYSFVISLILLILGYLIYGKFVDKRFKADNRETPANAVNDGVDYIPMPAWKVFLIQLLNIAGTGPIFGALSGAVFGPVVYLWIVFGSIFAGGVHDYLSGMISVRNNGVGVSEITGKYLGSGMKNVMRVFSIILLIMVGVVFTIGPADLLSLITPKILTKDFWFWVIVVYFFVATFVPIDKVIGRIYPLFGICLIVMALGVSGSLIFSGSFTMPEVWDNFANAHPEGISIWPYMFITVACGAVSGFHATQSPMMARCLKSEKQGRVIFYGTMITEGVIALVWAAAGVSCYESSRALLDAGAGCSTVVFEICKSTMGRIGGIFALLGVIACPISTGDTAYRSARLTIADWLKIDQSDLKKRFFLTIPILASGIIICQLDYSVVWRYFSWSNQTLAMIVLWAGAVYFKKENKNCAFILIPAAFMSAVTMTYFLCASECLGFFWDIFGISKKIYMPISYFGGIFFACLFTFLFFFKNKSNRIENGKK